MTLRKGDRVGRYRVLCPLGAGGMASVYAARVVGEGSFQRLVAVKLMLPHLGADERFARMFMDEAALAASIQSPHVVATLDLDREGDELFQALELVIGGSLRELLDEGEERGERLPIGVAVALLSQTARGLHDAHSAKDSTGAPLGLVHRDAEVADVIERALTRERETRTASAAQFADELLRAAEPASADEVIATLRAWLGPRIERLEATLQAALRDPVDAAPRVLDANRHAPRETLRRGVALALVAVALLLVGGGGYALALHQRAAEQSDVSDTSRIDTPAVARPTEEPPNTTDRVEGPLRPSDEAPSSGGRGGPVATPAPDEASTEGPARDPGAPRLRSRSRARPAGSSATADRSSETAPSHEVVNGIVLENADDESNRFREPDPETTPRDRGFDEVW